MGNAKVNKAKAFLSKYLIDRPKPFIAKAGVKKARYSDGGKVARKKNV